jgi:hypothetical protein
MHGTAPDEIALQLFHMGDDLLIAVRLGIALTPAVDACVGVDLHKAEVFASARVHEEGPYVGHLHRVLSSVTYSPAFTLGILGSTAIAGRSQSDTAFSKGRCPFPIDVDRRVVVALMRGPIGTGPDAVAQGDK